MIIYIEKEALKYNLTSEISNKFPDATILQISNYKNIFDKNISFKTEKNLILAKLKWDWISETPIWYAPVKKAFFFKTSLNCPFNCSYCYLKWAFKNAFQVIFVNYEDVAANIENTISQLRNSWYKDKIIFYASDYSDSLATENLTWFHKFFIPFFEKHENVEMETRTKSSNIHPLLLLWFAPKNTEVAFSLNPKLIIENHEIGSSDLDSRISSINKLMSSWFKVWLRFLPLLPINDYKRVYDEFLDYVLEKIDLKKINSVSVWSLLYTKDDYLKILKKEKDSDYLYRLTAFDDSFIRAPVAFRNEIYALFKEKLEHFNICLDNYEN
ncbi:MAG: hypothetical protein ACD_3C00111G0010 [uncultured bacterium (gcode 4)]|uniref:Spore photoproduct lyase n=1 Tax=uncultured bacterium (gcode 4) TaxID=1234023 RepID=K2FYH4_9BACT|nr:MAG: hypothetical protein ACD_3C00111G0010 [uncultured bacterium (gcode 4)]